MDAPKLIIQKLDIPQDRRLIAISDIHGELDLFKSLLEKVSFCDDDILVILGDFYLKGSQPEPCFHYVMELAKRPNVHVLRGNCDWGRADFYTDEMWDWVCGLPIIIESDDFIFVHAGLENKPLDQQDVIKCLTTPNFMGSYDGEPFEKWVIVGHWPTVNYRNIFPCYNILFNDCMRIIDIDGGAGVKKEGQLNALIIKNGDFECVSVDAFPVMVM
ncbi:MAG: metallophosphoesterase, partial [Defluviitaleaceae bacterium]|nr:metallophosphoesterase [Defluviitaleaceae bacterium]